MEKKVIYLDNAATTRTAPEVVEAMLPYFSEHYGNPSSIYALAGESREGTDRARAQIAAVLNAEAKDIYFTAGGTEADNWALKAAFEAYRDKGNHIITTKIEHHAILHTCEYRRNRGGQRSRIWMWMRKWCGETGRSGSGDHAGDHFDFCDVCQQ